MYEQLKNLIPKSFIKKNEKFLRKLIATFYAGNPYQCNICDFQMSRFITLKNTDQICPKCGSIGRNRKLWNLIENELSDKTVLHFSPSPSVQEKIQASNVGTYITTDYAGEFNATKNLNIEAIDEPDHTYDLIICYHILEHVVNDLQAMSELYRISKPGGKCIIQTPFTEGEIYEDASIQTEEDRLKHFGQEDHVRIYSVKGLRQRLESVGFSTTPLYSDAQENNVNGFKKGEQIIWAHKPQ